MQKTDLDGNNEFGSPLSTANKLYKFGLYQKKLAILLFLSAVTNPFSGLQFLVTHYTPPYRCAHGRYEQYQMVGKNRSQDFLNITELLKVDDGKKSCQRYNISIEQLALDNENTSQWEMVPCDQIHFNSSFPTAVTEFEMICSRAWFKPTTVSIFMVGKILGGQVGGFVSDRYGRRVAFLVATFAQSLSSFVTSFADSVVVYMILIFTSGSTSVVNFSCAVLLGAESVEPKYRNFMYFAIESGYAFGYMTLPLFGYFVPDWRWYLRVTGLLGVLYIPYCWLIHETPLWLINNGKSDEAEILFEKIAKMNKIRMNFSKAECDELVKEQTVVTSKNKGTTWEYFKEMFKVPVLVGRLFACIYAWILVSLTYYVIALNNDNLSGNRFLNIFFGGLVELASAFGFWAGTTRYGGRNTYIIFMSISGLLIGCTPLLAQWSGTVVVIATMISKLFVSICYNLLYIYVGELYPTNMRQSILALVGAIARVGPIISPFIIFAGESGSTVAPSVGMAIAIILSVFTFLFLPNTAMYPFPNTVEEAKSLKGSILSCPCKRSQTLSVDKE